MIHVMAAKEAEGHGATALADDERVCCESAAWDGSGEVVYHESSEMTATGDWVCLVCGSGTSGPRAKQ